jgi:methyltransferase
MDTGMRVLLIWPHNARAVLSDELSCCEPLPLEYLAGALRPHHDVTVRDLRLDPPLERLADDGEEPDLIGLALPYTTAVRSARDTALEVRRLWPGTPVVIGGHHPSVSLEWLAGFPCDYVVSGEGAAPLLSLVEQLERGASVAPEPGLASLADAWDVPPRPPPTSLAGVPSPDRSVVARHRDSYFHAIYRPVALMRFSAGCPYRCNFCSLWRATDRRYLTKEIPRIVRELEEVDVENVYVVDDEAFIQPQRMLELADGIDDAGIRKRYHMYLRTDTALRRPEVIERWAGIGLDSVLVGAESMHDSELAGYEKGTTVEQTRAALALFHGLGIKVRANFIVQPSWTLAEFDHLERMVAELEIDVPSFSVLTPLPGTNLYDDCRTRLISDNPELFDCYHTLLPTRLPLERFYAALARLLANSAARSSPGLNTTADPSIFYFSHDGAFQRMLHAVREGHHWNRERWTADVPSLT